MAKSGIQTKYYFFMLKTLKIFLKRDIGMLVIDSLYVWQDSRWYIDDMYRTSLYEQPLEQLEIQKLVFDAYS